MKFISTFLITIVFISGFHVSYAQKVKADSLFFYPLENNNLEAGFKSVTNLHGLPYNSIGITQLSSNFTKGAYRQGFEAYQTLDANFYTQGLKQIGRFKVAGSLQITKGWEDSLAFNLQGVYNDAQPYFFYAGKAGKFERQNYDIKALLSYELIKNRLFIGASIGYQNNWTTRSVDPRVDVKQFTYNLNPELTLKIGSHFIGASYRYGGGYEFNTVKYKSSMYDENLSYLERINFLSFGLSSYSISKKPLRRYDTYNGFGIHYTGIIKTIKIQGNFKYTLWQQDNVFVSDANSVSRKNYTLDGYIQSDNAEGNLLITQDKNNHSQQLGIDFNTQSLLNWTRIYNGTNYQYTHNQFNLFYQLMFNKNKSVNYLLGISGLYKNSFKQDVATSHQTEISFIQPELKLGVFKTLKNKTLLGATISPFYRHVIDNYYIVPSTQENYYTKGMVYTNFLYWQSPAIGTNFSLKLNTPNIFKKNTLGFVINGTYLKPTSTVANTIDAVYTPNGDRLALEFLLRVYM